MKIRKGDVIVFINSYNKGVGEVLKVGQNTIIIPTGTILKDNITAVNGVPTK